jgi:hypothetical protein
MTSSLIKAVVLTFVSLLLLLPASEAAKGPKVTHQVILPYPAIWQRANGLFCSAIGVILGVL